MLSLISLLLPLCFNMTYYFPESPFYYDYDLKVVDGVVSFCNPNNTQSEYHFYGYGNNSIELYGNGVVYIYNRAYYFDTIYVPEPESLLFFMGVFLWKMKMRK